MTRFAAVLLDLITWMLDEDVTHHGRAEIVRRRLMAAHAGLAADIVDDLRGVAPASRRRCGGRLCGWRGRLRSRNCSGGQATSQYYERTYGKRKRGQ